MGSATLFLAQPNKSSFWFELKFLCLIPWRAQLVTLGKKPMQSFSSLQCAVPQGAKRASLKVSSSPFCNMYYSVHCKLWVDCS